MTLSPIRLILISCLSLLACLSIGCSSTINGKVVAGDRPGITVVKSNSALLEQRGLAGAAVWVTVDPKEIRPKRIGPVMTDEQGRFSINPKAFGGGLLEYEVEIAVAGKNYQTVMQRMPLPGSGKTVYVELVPGRTTLPYRDEVAESLEYAQREKP